MGSVEAPLSLTSGCIADNVTPHYLLPSSGSCHDLCKYGRRRTFDDSSADAKKANKPSHGTKSSSSRPKNHSNSPSRRRCTSTGTVKRGGAVSFPAKAPVQVKETNNSVGKKPHQQLMKPSASVRPKPVMVSCGSSHGVYGKRRRNENVLSGKNAGASLSAKKAWVPVGAPLPRQGRKTSGVKRVKTDSSDPMESIPALPSSSSPFQEEDSVDDQHSSDTGNAQHVEENEINIPRMEAGSNEFEFESEPECLTDAPSTSSLREADEVVSDTTMSQRKRNHYKRQRRSWPGDKHCRLVRIKFRTGNQMHQNKDDNSPTRNELRRARRKEDVSDCSNSTRIGSLKASRSRDQHGSKARQNRCRRVRYVKARVLVLDNMTRKFDKEDAAAALLLSRRINLKSHQVRRRQDVQYIFSYVVEETLSKLAERRKGMVKSLIGEFESLISLQTRSRFLLLTARM